VYDRAGRGWSDAADGPQDGAHIAADLHTLLDRAQVPGPYVLAGHSFGGLYVLSFAAQFPDQVASMVLLDSTAPKPGPARATNTESYSVLRRVSALLPAAAHLGAVRLLAHADYGT
jgi:pimeloyl-ACP methyl ester carboxylesterase